MSGRELQSTQRALGLPLLSRSISALSTAITTTRTLFGLSLVDPQRTSVKIGTVESLHGACSIRIRHLYEAKPTRAARLAIVDQRQRFDRSVRRK
jgi:hypothetical protein